MTGGLKFSLVTTLAVIFGFGFVPALHAQFETRTSMSVLPDPVSIATGDFNHDGKLDLVVASTLNTTQVRVLLGVGDGTFRPGVDYAVGSEPYSVAVADVNRDGKLDIVVANYLSSNVSVLLGNGDGTFQPAANYNGPPGPQFIGIGDFNGDHLPDLVTLAFGDACRCVSVWLNKGNGTFQAPINTAIPFPYALSIAIGDFNRDGKLDVTAVGWFESTSEIQVFLGNGDGTFSPGASYPGLFAGLARSADLRGNGKLDLIVANDQAGDDVYVFLGNGDGTFASPVGYSASWPASLATADFNGDGKLDLLVADDLPPSSSVSVLLGNGDGTFKGAVAYPVGYESNFVVTGDFNGDRRPDIAVANLLYSSVSVLLNTGAVSLSPITPLNFPFQLVGSRSAPQTVTLSNTGTSALTISSVKATGQFGVRSTCGSSVAPGGNCTLSVTFLPTSQGTKSGTISIRDSASSKPQVIELSGAGTVVELTPLSLNFGSQKVGGKSAPQTVQLTNTGAAALSITQLIDNGTNSKDFPQTNNCPSSLGAGSSCTITVTFQPQKTGARTGQISITDSGGGSPQVVPVSGTGD